MRIDREFHDPKIVEALERVDETTLLEILDNAEVLDALKHARKQNESTRPAADFFADINPTEKD